MFTLGVHHQDPLPACRRISFGSHILPTSQFGHITKCTLAFAWLVDRYLMFDSNVPPAVWCITIPVQRFVPALFFVVGSFRLKLYIVLCIELKAFSFRPLNFIFRCCAF